MKNKFFLIICTLHLFSCGSVNPERQAPPPDSVDYITVQSQNLANLKDPQVNILFVVDNSGSMQNYQTKLSRNIEQFSKIFFKNNRIDYKIGVVPVYDSKYLNDKTLYKSGLRKMNALGELIKLKGLADSEDQEQVYITRHTLNPQKVLQETVLLGTQWGPEAEESFSPVLAITDENINAEKNNHFYDKEAYLAVIFLTDADDVTPSLSAEEFYQKLVTLKNGDRSKILIAAALPNLNNNSDSCTKDGRGPIQAFPSLLSASGGIFADLCSDHFGSRLADFGQFLVQRLTRNKVPLNFTPDMNSLEVSYGSQNSVEAERIHIERGVNGYYFDPEKNEVVISSEIQLAHQSDYVIFVKAKPADLSNFKNDYLKQIK